MATKLREEMGRNFKLFSSNPSTFWSFIYGLGYQESRRGAFSMVFGERFVAIQYQFGMAKLE